VQDEKIGRFSSRRWAVIDNLDADDTLAVTDIDHGL
jgi:hypothetical protein